MLQYSLCFRTAGLAVMRSRVLLGQMVDNLRLFYPFALWTRLARGTEAQGGRGGPADGDRGGLNMSTRQMIAM